MLRLRRVQLEKLCLRKISISSLPASRRCSIWSVISDMRGDITRVQPAVSKAGSWYVNDFPPPMHHIQLNLKS